MNARRVKKIRRAARESAQKMADAVGRELDPRAIGTREIRRAKRDYARRGTNTPQKTGKLIRAIIQRDKRSERRRKRRQKLAKAS